MKRTLLVLAAGCVLGWGLASFPVAHDSYTVRSKQRCLTDEGLSFSLKYKGRGQADFVVLPPSTTTTTLPEKGKKEEKK